MNYLGDFVEDDVVYFMFNTFSSDDPSASVTITNFANTDVHIHKDDGLTQRNNAAGITVSVNFDGITGSHLIKIDTNDNTVAGFWVTGHDYFVRIEGTTIDGATINAVVGHFSIQNRYTRGTDSAALAATALSNVTWTDAKAGQIDAAISSRNATTPPTVAQIRAEMEGAGHFMDLIKADTNELQTDWKNDGRLDVLLDACNTTTPPTAVANAIAVWDRILTGATHNIATSAGRRVREIGAYAIHSATAQAGNGHSITLAASASPSDALYHGIYNRNLIILTDNIGVGQTRTIVDYDAITKVAVVDRDWRISPDATTEYQIVPDDTPLTMDHGVARGGTATTITIREYAADYDDAYLCNQIAIIAGTGRGQVRLVGSYVGATRVATICGDDWGVIPDTTSIYVMMPYGTTCASCVGTYALSQIKSEADDALSDVDLDTHDQNIKSMIRSDY